MPFVFLKSNVTSCFAYVHKTELLLVPLSKFTYEGNDCMKELYEHADQINALLARNGVRFGIYKNNEFKEQLFPFDPIPRIITKSEFDVLERGLIQRVTALNIFLEDIYSDKKIIKDGVIPPDFIYSSSVYSAVCDGVKHPNQIASHISGIDLVRRRIRAGIFLRIICVFLRVQAIRL